MEVHSLRDYQCPVVLPLLIFKYHPTNSDQYAQKRRFNHKNIISAESTNFESMDNQITLIFRIIPVGFRSTYFIKPFFVYDHFAYEVLHFFKSKINH